LAEQAQARLRVAVATDEHAVIVRGADLRLALHIGAKDGILLRLDHRQQVEIARGEILNEEGGFAVAGVLPGVAIDLPGVAGEADSRRAGVGVWPQHDICRLAGEFLRWRARRWRLAAALQHATVEG